MENSKINMKCVDAAFIGVAFSMRELGNVAYIDNSEIYSCVEEYCHPVSVNHDDPEIPVYGTIVHISSTLLHGGPVNWDSISLSMYVGDR